MLCQLYGTPNTTTPCRFPLHWSSPRLTRSRNCVPMAFTNENLPGQGQQFSSQLDIRALPIIRVTPQHGPTNNSSIFPYIQWACLKQVCVWIIHVNDTKRNTDVLYNYHIYVVGRKKEKHRSERETVIMQPAVVAVVVPASIASSKHRGKQMKTNYIYLLEVQISIGREREREIKRAG